MLIKEILREDEEITAGQLKAISLYADKLFKAAGLDIVFTRHFLDRINDPRNLKPIKSRELVDVFNKAYRQLDHGREIARLGPEAQAVLKDIEKDINMPFILKWDEINQELDIVFKTVMRKHNFISSNPTLKVENKYNMHINEILLEGGNVFPDVKPFTKEQAAGILSSINKVMPKGMPLIKVGSAGQKPVSGDMDVMVDEDALLKYFSKQIKDQLSNFAGKKAAPKPAQIARALLKEYFKAKGFDAAQTGINVHVKVATDKDPAQVDIMLVKDAANVSKFHQHDYTGKFRGSHKHQLMSSIAKHMKSKKYPNGLMWSAFQGLFNRDEQGKKDQLITRDPDTVAKMLLHPKATVKDLGNVESILKAIPLEGKDIKIQQFKDEMAKEDVAV